MKKAHIRALQVLRGLVGICFIGCHLLKCLEDFGLYRFVWLRVDCFVCFGLTLQKVESVICG